MGATWNKDLMSKVGKGLGMEAKLKNAGVLLGPTINIHRHPYGNDTCALPRFTTFVHSFADRTTGGRTFESFSEDAILSGELAVALVKGARLNPFSSSATDYRMASLNIPTSQSAMLALPIRSKAPTMFLLTSVTYRGLTQRKRRKYMSMASSKHSQKYGYPWETLSRSRWNLTRMHLVNGILT